MRYKPYTVQFINRTSGLVLEFSWMRLFGKARSCIKFLRQLVPGRHKEGDKFIDFTTKWSIKKISLTIYGTNLELTIKVPKQIVSIYWNWTANQSYLKVICVY